MAAKYKYTKANVHQTREKVYQFIIKYVEENGYSPSVRDICNGADIKSTSTVHNHLNQLNQEGRITYSDGKRRAIVIPEIENQINHQFRNAPLIGKITAGTPILATENIQGHIPIPDYFNKYEDVYALRVEGDSMQDAAIMNDDIVFVNKANSAEKGKIIVGLIDEEATIKQLGEIEGRPYLLPRNANYSPIPFFDENCKILGIVIGVLRVSI
ncbi:MAG: transcriptional repressor LexA [Clostridiaceae bacterium]|nr:transcriptional repressor LexA [Clostridiaceae bacterium]